MSLSPEWRLLLACAKTNLTTDGQNKAHDLARGDLDWDFLAKTSCKHGIAPLIYVNLQRSGVMNVVSASAVQLLRGSYYGNAARNALLFDELGAVLGAFKENGIDVIVLKGAALAEIVYPHRALRAMSDIDLLVRKERLDEAGSKLLSMGYRRDASEVFSLEHHYHFVFKKRAAINIELHWHVKFPTDVSRIDIGGFWERAQSTTITGIETLTLSPEDLFLHLCHHAYKHKFIGGIRPLCDIAEAARFYGGRINWKNIIALATQWQIAPCVYLELSLARELLDAQIPQSILKDLKPMKFNVDVMTWTRERMLTNSQSSPVFPELVELLWKGRGLKERWAVLQRILSPNVAATHCGYPSESKRSYFYYPRRINYLFRQYGPVIWALLSGDPTVRAAAEKLDKQMRLTKWLSSGLQ